MKQTSSTILALIVKAALLLPVCSAYLWWAYSMGSQGRNGFPPKPDAVPLVLEMGCVVTALTVIVWVIGKRLHRRMGLAGVTIGTTLETAAILFAYTALVLAWREGWTPARGMSESAAFLPILGHVNAEFFGNEGFWEFLIVVLPFISLFSGALTFGFEFIQRRTFVRRRNA
jgi:hypothetical protein